MIASLIRCFEISTHQKYKNILILLENMVVCSSCVYCALHIDFASGSHMDNKLFVWIKPEIRRKTYLLCLRGIECWWFGWFPPICWHYTWVKRPAGATLWLVGICLGHRICFVRMILQVYGVVGLFVWYSHDKMDALVTVVCVWIISFLGINESVFKSSLTFVLEF